MAMRNSLRTISLTYMPYCAVLLSRYSFSRRPGPSNWTFQWRARTTSLLDGLLSEGDSIDTSMNTDDARLGPRTEELEPEQMRRQKMWSPGNRGVASGAGSPRHLPFTDSVTTSVWQRDLTILPTWRERVAAEQPARRGVRGAGRKSNATNFGTILATRLQDERR